MTEHHINEAVFKLPPELKDKTVHMFVTADDGPNEFNVVVTRANVEASESINDFVHRLSSELKSSLPAFELLRTSERSLGESLAIELSYRWNNGGIAMHQRQVSTLVLSAVDEIKQAIMIAATCPKPFDDHWNKVFDDLLESVQLRHPVLISGDQPHEHPDESAPLASEATSSLPIENVPYVFALRMRDHILHVFFTSDEACRSISAIEVEDKVWSFFDADGNALHADFIEPNSGKIWRTAGRYVLRCPSLPNADTLERRLDHVQGVRGFFPLNSVSAVREHLAQARARSLTTASESEAG